MKLRRLIPIAALALLLVGCGTNKNSQSSTQKSPEIAKVDKILATKGQEFSVGEVDHGEITKPNNIKVHTDSAVGGDGTQYIKLKRTSSVKVSGKTYGVYSYTSSGVGGIGGVGESGRVMLAEIKVHDKDCLAFFTNFKGNKFMEKYRKDVEKGLKGNSYYIDEPYYIV